MGTLQQFIEVGPGSGVGGLALVLPPSVFSITGSPILGPSGTFTAAFVVQSANKFFAGPASGADAAPTFRAMSPADIPLDPPVTLVQTVGTIPVDAALARNYEVQLTQNATIGSPTHLSAGMVINLAIQQPSSGGPYTLTFAAIWDFGGSGAPSASVTASAVDFVSGYYHAPSNKILAAYRKGT